MNYENDNRNETDQQRHDRFMRYASNAMENMNVIERIAGEPSAHNTSKLCSSIHVFEQKVSWTNILGEVEEVTAESLCLKDAIEQAFIKAQARGWAPKKWWQIWRWMDTPDLRKDLSFYMK